WTKESLQNYTNFLFLLRASPLVNLSRQCRASRRRIAECRRTTRDDDGIVDCGLAMGYLSPSTRSGINGSLRTFSKESGGGGSRASWRARRAEPLALDAVSREDRAKRGVLACQT